MARNLVQALLLPSLIGLLSCAGPAGVSSETGADSVVAAGAKMKLARSGHTATLLPDGQILVTGGMNGNGAYFADCELYDPVKDTFTAGPSMSARRVGHTATLLPSGKVLIAGGFNGDYTANAELYDPATHTFTATG